MPDDKFLFVHCMQKLIGELSDEVQDLEFAAEVCGCCMSFNN